MKIPERARSSFLSFVAAACLVAPASAQQVQIILPTTNLQVQPSTVTIPTTNNQGQVEVRNAITLTQQPDIKLNIVTVNKPTKSGPLCGGFDEATQRPQPACGGAAAKFESKAQPSCPAGTFFDLFRWSCWKCPPGFPDRGLAAIDTDRACTRPDPNAKGSYRAAEFKGTVCPADTFHDPIRDGECWKCPSDFDRAIGTHIDSGNACHKRGREELFKASRHGAGTGLFRSDCPAGQFLDLYDGHCYSCPGGRRTAHHITRGDSCARDIREEWRKADLVKKATCEAGEHKDFLRNPSKGGECWRCPQAWDRSVFAINGPTACQEGVGVAFGRAIKDSDLTCPAGQIFDFVDGGTCWSCPDGYKRSMSHVKNADACVVKAIGWNSIPFAEPGLFGLPGAQQVVLDIVKRHPALMKQAIETTAKTVSTRNKQDYNTALAKEHKLFVSSPELSTAAAAAVFVRLIAAAADPVRSSPYEKELVKSFSAHVVKKRTYVAQQALDAYDNWKKLDDYYRIERSKGPQTLALLVDYGTVPPDFSAIGLLTTIGVGAGGIGISQGASAAADAVGKNAAIATGALPIVGDVLSVALSAGGNGFGDFSNPDKAAVFLTRQAAEIAIGKVADLAVQKLIQSTAQKLAQQMIQRGLAATLEQTAAKIAERSLAAAGAAPGLIVSGMMLIASIALDQVQEIVNARPKLEASLAQAKYPPDLSRMVASDSGVAELMGIWAEATAGDGAPGEEFKRDFAKAAPSIVVASTAPTQLSSGVTVNWARVPGLANAISVGANGAVWHIGTDTRPGGFGIYRLTGNNWTNVPGGALRVAVDPQGNGWVTNDQKRIFRWDGGKWVDVPGLANDLAIGANGSIWHIGTDARPGGFGIYRWDGKQWANVQGGAVRIAVDPQGNAWVANDRQEIFRFDGRGWTKVDGLARDIAVGANGTVWHVGTNQVPGGYGLYYLSANGWVNVPGGLTDITVGPDGKAWGANSGKEIYRMQ